MIHVIFIGRFIDSDNEDAEIQEMQFEGFLKDEYLHYDLGMLMICLIILIVALLIAIIIKDLVKTLTLKRFLYVKNYHWAKQRHRERFMTEIEERSKYKFLAVKQRGDQRLEMIPLYLPYLSRFDQDQSKNQV